MNSEDTLIAFVVCVVVVGIVLILGGTIYYTHVERMAHCGETHAN